MTHRYLTANNCPKPPKTFGSKKTEENILMSKAGIKSSIFDTVNKEKPKLLRLIVEAVM